MMMMMMIIIIMRESANRAVLLQRHSHAVFSKIETHLFVFLFGSGREHAIPPRNKNIQSRIRGLIG
jgi:hypothetical protein